MKSLTFCFSLVVVACTALSGCGVSTSSILPGQQVELKTGMTQEEVRAAAGLPDYRYSVNGNETWVYTRSSLLADEAKSMALNMVPVAGPLVNFGTSLTAKPVEATSAVTFGPEGKVDRFEQAQTGVESGAGSDD